VYYLKSGHNLFHSHHFQFNIHYSSYHSRIYIERATETVVKETRNIQIYIKETTAEVSSSIKEKHVGLLPTDIIPEMPA
jgi:hypothetical protein